jgi:hypothetical protein
MKKFRIKPVEQSKEERLKEIDHMIERLKFKRWAIETKYRDDLTVVNHDIKLFEEERERLNAEDT